MWPSDPTPSSTPGRRGDRLLRSQWRALRDWIAAEAVLEQGDAPSALDGWTVRDLVAHVGRSFTTVTGLRATDEPPRSIVRYVAGYRDAAGEIAEQARSRSADADVPLLAWIDRVADEAFAALDGIEAPVVRGPRGPLTRADFVTTRLVELVVHGDDLVRSIPSVRTSPLLDDAVAAVARALVDGYAAATGSLPPAGLTGDGDLVWIRAATGRAASPDPHLPLL